MITDSSKDYGTGNVLMILDGKTTTEDVMDYLKRNYGINDARGAHLEWTPESQCKGFVNQATAVYVRDKPTDNDATRSE